MISSLKYLQIILMNAGTNFYPTDIMNGVYRMFGLFQYEYLEIMEILI